MASIKVPNEFIEARRQNAQRNHGLFDFGGPHCRCGSKQIVRFALVCASITSGRYSASNPHVPAASRAKQYGGSYNCGLRKIDCQLRPSLKRVMLEQAAFETLIGRIRAGDEAAAAELVSIYEPLIRRVVRLQIRDRRLYRLFESIDVSQSVLGSFFTRTALGEYDLETPEHLVKLLVVMSRNKVASASNQQRRQRRDSRRTTGPEELAGIVDPGPSPSEQVSRQELLDRFRAGFNDEERAIAGLRKDGLSWAEITTQLGGNPQARRMQLARAVERISRQIGLDVFDA